MFEIHPNGTESVARQRYYENQHLHGGDPVREIWPVILKVVQLLLYIWLARNTLPERSPTVAEKSEEGFCFNNSLQIRLGFFM